MTARVLIGSTIKVSRPGVDVTTAGEKDLLLSIGSRYGQIVGSGYVPLSKDPNALRWLGTGFFGPFARVPDIMGAVQMSNGLLLPQGHHLALGVAGPSVIERAAFVQDMTVTPSSISLNVSADVNATQFYATPAAFLYVIFRKPFAS